MKETKKFLGVIAILAIIVFWFTACDDSGLTDSTETLTHKWCEWNVTKPATMTEIGEKERICINCYAKEKRIIALIGGIGEGGGIVFYNNPNGFTVIGTGSFTAYYLEAAPSDQGINLTWASSAYINTYITGTGTAIGTGKANTDAILAVDADAPAALVCKNYINGGKNDWFLPSKDELNEMYKTKEQAGIKTTGYLWSSSQCDFMSHALIQYFIDGSQYDAYKSNYDEKFIRAIRAF